MAEGLFLLQDHTSRLTVEPNTAAETGAQFPPKLTSRGHTFKK